jgi:S-methylmethionine-dependent homocysteine/selenocysteine methylase
MDRREVSLANYQDLKDRLDRGEVIVLDGAVGTQLQAMGAPNDPYCWAAIANHTHPFTVRKMHEDYIKAGVDIITTNTYSSARHNYEPVGLADQIYELNLRAVVLAQEARDRVATKPVYIGGSISNFGAWTEEDFTTWTASGQLRGRTTSFGMRMHGVMTEGQVRRNLQEQVEILADAGVDFIIAEATGGFLQRKWVLEAAASVGLPFWAGYKCHVSEEEDVVRTGYESEMLLAEELDKLLPIGGDVVTIFHSEIQDTYKAIPVVKAKWSGPVAAYPEAGRRDYVYDLADPGAVNQYSPQEWVQVAQQWVSQGVQVIGGCCGMGLEYIQVLQGQLPDSLPSTG